MSGTRHVLSGTDARSQAWMEIWSHCGNDEKGGSYEVAFGVMTRILAPPYQLDGLHIGWRGAVDVPIRPYRWLFNK